MRKNPNSNTLRYLYGTTVLMSVLMISVSSAGEIGHGKVYSIIELSFTGPHLGPNDTPARDINFWSRFQHEANGKVIKVWGFWDGDGQGGSTGHNFKIRFCPTQSGRWRLVEVYADHPKLKGKKQDDYITATDGDFSGFWLVDSDSPGRRWYRRSDGSHQYIFGNTHYTFLSGYQKGEIPTGNDIAQDIAGNADYFKKLRFSLFGGRYVNPQEKPFFDNQGRLSDNGDDSHRPNPRWFHQRVDLAVRTAWQRDLIADLILCGPDTVESRSTLRAGHNNGNSTPWLKYIAARYGSFPNVWLCLCNEFDIKKPKYTAAHIARCGKIIKRYLPYPTPLSVHTVPRTLWPSQFDILPDWHDHQIIQKKIRNLTDSADTIQATWKNPRGITPRRKPTINDELSYQGKGDKHSELDTIESHLGAFLGGGYGTTSEKPGSKLGQYFWGRFNPREHTAADNLKYLREVIDRHITFWKMAPDLSIFANLDKAFRGMAWPEREYVLGTNRAQKQIIAQLPSGTWTITRFEIIKKQMSVLRTNATGRFSFDAPDSRAVLFHFKKNE